MNIQQLRAQIAALQDATMDENRNFRSAYDEGKFDALSAVDTLLDSLQEEPVKRTHADIDAAMQEVEDKSKAFTKAHKGENADDILAQMRGEELVSEQNLFNVERTVKDCKEEPINEDLEKISYYFACMCHPLKTAYSISSPNPEIIKAFKAGAKWQFEKVTEALLSEVLPCFMHGGEADEVVAKLDEVLNFQKK